MCWLWVVLAFLLGGVVGTIFGGSANKAQRHEQQVRLIHLAQEIRRLQNELIEAEVRSEEKAWWLEDEEDEE